MTKVASYLQQGVSVVVVDVVTERTANLHAELAELLHLPDTFDWQSTSGLSAVTYRVVKVKDGEKDISFLSLTDPEFDLSDRGVEGREAAPPVDAFLTTDRGAYRSGETVYVTALARDAEQAAVEGLPLTAVLLRPDGVEYSRQLVEDRGAGGHVFELPIAGSAPRAALAAGARRARGGSVQEPVPRCACASATILSRSWAGTSS